MRIATYREKLLELDRLKSELEKMEKSQRIQKELQFISDIHKVLKKHSRSVADLAVAFPELSGVLGKGRKTTKAGSARKRKASPTRTFKHPKTGETLKVQRTNNKTLKSWALGLGVSIDSLEVK